MRNKTLRKILLVAALVATTLSVTNVTAYAMTQEEIDEIIRTMTGEEPVYNPSTVPEEPKYETIIVKIQEGNENTEEDKDSSNSNEGSETKKETPQKIVLSKKEYTYDGKAKKPTVTVKDKNGKTVNSKYYTVKYPSGRKNVGTYTIKVTFKGNYSGTAEAEFKINPPKASLKSVKAGKKKITVKWGKKTSQVTGYQIEYSTSNKFGSGSITETVNSNKTTSKTIEKLNSKKKYYVRIRTYKTVNGTDFYSAWSTAKSVTTL